MIDRIEELLWSLAAEDDEEREGVLALTAKEEAAPVPPYRDEGETGDGGTERADANRELWKDGPVWSVQSAGLETDRALKIAAAERMAQTEKSSQPSRGGGLVWTGLERAARDGAAGLAPEGAERPEAAQAGLKGLYRQTVQGLRPAASALPPEQAGRTARVQEPGSAASLAVDELDRAVRRDSRRYDGGMSIY